MSLDTPLTVLLQIIHGCNISCQFCYVGTDRNHLHPRIPPLARTIEIIDLIEQAGVQEVVLLGGEPTMHPHLATICRDMASRSFVARGIVTNGTVLDPRITSVLKDSGFWVDVSIRGPDSATYRELTNSSDAFERSMAGLRLLAASNIAVGVEYDCTTANYNRLYDSVRNIYDLGVSIRQVQLHRFIPAGDAAVNLDIRPELSHYLEVFAQMSRIRNELGIPAIFEDGFPLCLVERSFWELIAPCGCGYSLLAIGLDGEFKHCICSEYTLGNISTTPIREIWNGPLLGEYRSASRYHPQCRGCDLLDICRGGCRSSACVAGLAAHDFFADKFQAQKLADRDALDTKLVFAQSIRVSRPGC